MQYEGENRLVKAYSQYAFSYSAPEKMIKDYVAMCVADIRQIMGRSVDVLAYMAAYFYNIPFAVCFAKHKLLFL